MFTLIFCTLEIIKPSLIIHQLINMNKTGKNVKVKRRQIKTPENQNTQQQYQIHVHKIINFILHTFLSNVD